MSNVIDLFRPKALDGLQPPHDPMAEAATLTSCMLQPETAAEALAIAGPEDFFWAAHRAIALSIAELVAEGTPPEMTAVGSQLRKMNRLAIVGDVENLVTIVNQVPAITNPAHYARTVRELATVRRLATTLHRLVAETYEPQPDVPAFFARVDAAIAEHTRRTAERDVATALEATKAIARELTEAPKPTVTTGLRDLDRLTTGFEQGAMYILAARPGMGKTALAVQMAVSAAKRGAKVLVFSLEMGQGELTRRAVCGEAGVPLQAIRDRTMTPAQWSGFTHAASTIAQLPLVIADKPGQTLLDVKAQSRRHKPGLVVVDHIGLLRAAAGSNAARRSREQEVAEFSRGLKMLAKELGIPVLALCQVGRDVAKNARRPSMSDLRESGSIEQDADGVWLIHRPGYYDPKATGTAADDAELIVAKQRNGPTGIVTLRWDGALTRFAEASW